MITNPPGYAPGTKYTPGFAVYKYENRLAYQPEYTRWICHGESEVREVAVYIAYQVDRADPGARIKIVREFVNL